MTVAAAEAAVGLGIIIAIFRNRESLDVDDAICLSCRWPCVLRRPNNVQIMPVCFSLIIFAPLAGAVINWFVRQASCIFGRE